MILRQIQRSGFDRDDFLLTVKDSKMSSPVEFIPDQNRGQGVEKDRFFKQSSCVGAVSASY